MTQRDLIDTILNGYRALGRKIQEKKIQYKTEVVPHLTPKEIEVLDYIAQGQSNKEIAATLNISLQTVKNHIHSIMLKLDVKNRTKLAALVKDKTVVKAHLTPKEIEILDYIAQGQSNREIANLLNIPLQRIENHLHSIMVKLNITARSKPRAINMDKTIVKAHLTPKEIEVLSCITQGQSNREIAATLNIALQTVKNHILSIMLKVNVKKRTKLVPLNIEKVKLSETSNSNPSHSLTSTPSTF